MKDNSKRPNRHSNPSRYGKKHSGKFRFLRKKKRETTELLKALP